MSKRCLFCEEFFSQFSCAKASIFYNGECDCPECLGYCECDEEGSDEVETPRGQAQE